MVDLEGALYVEVFNLYEEMYCCIEGRKFSAYRKAKGNLPAVDQNKAEIALQVSSLNFIHLNYID